MITLIRLAFFVIDFIEDIPVNARFLLFCAWWFPTYPLRRAYQILAFKLYLRRLRRNCAQLQRRYFYTEGE